MKFTIEEIETIKNSLIISLSHPEELEDEKSVIILLDKIDEEYEID